ncbi:MAG: hypothetical protein ACFFC7_24055 [Candidatus Hermodarchaeota archaeon]
MKEKKTDNQLSTQEEWLLPKPQRNSRKLFDISIFAWAFVILVFGLPLAAVSFAFFTGRLGVFEVGLILFIGSGFLIINWLLISLIVAIANQRRKKKEEMVDK